MKVEKTIRAMADRALGEDFIKILDEDYFDEGEDYFKETEGAYQAAIRALEGISEDMRGLLDEQSKLFTSNKIYAVRFSFACGQYSGFKQHFAPGRGDDDFSILVDKGLFEVPGMERHPIYFQNLDRINQLGDNLRKGLGTEVEEHLVSIECALDERIYHAAVMAFYCGYRSALYCIERVRPDLQFSILPQQLYTEWSLGLIPSYDQLEGQGWAPKKEA